MFLKTLRIQQYGTQTALAQASQPPVAQNTISRLECDAAAQPTWRTVVALAQALGVPPESLRFGPPPPPRLRRRGRRGPSSAEAVVR